MKGLERTPAVRDVDGADEESVGDSDEGEMDRVIRKSARRCYS